MLQLSEWDHWPSELADLPAAKLHEILPGPTLIHLPGRRQEPLFVSVLLHGNEDVGWLAIQQLMRGYSERMLPRSLSILIGNIAAARLGVRRREGEPDYNRVWPGTNAEPSPETRLMAQVVATMRQRHVFAAVDIHNNTGLNPHYACLNRLEPEFLHLAGLFSRTVVHFVRPLGVMSAAFAEFCPSVTLECGKVGDAAGVTHSSEFLDACLHLAEHPHHPVPEGDIHLFHTVATVKVRPECSFSFDGSPADLQFPADWERLNFKELHPGFALAQVKEDSALPLQIVDDHDQVVSERFVTIEQQVLRLKRMVMPAMLTCHAQVIRQDCLGYLMERLNLSPQDVASGNVPQAASLERASPVTRPLSSS